MPAEFAPILPQLIYKPDRNRGETKALEAACGETGKSAARLLFDCGALPSTHDYHLGRFLFEFFPEGKGGTGFPDFRRAGRTADLPLAEVAAFSVDDAHTTKSTMPSRSRQARRRLAASASTSPRRASASVPTPTSAASPANGCPRCICRDARSPCCRRTWSSISRWPPGTTVAAISLYLDVATDYRLLGHETRMERVPIVANLRHHDIEPLFNADTLAAGLGEFPYATS
jgi:exoribonuclease-2